MSYGDRPYITKEERELCRTQIEIIWDGNIHALQILRYVFHTFKRWPEVFAWLIRNKICGAKLVEFYQNEGDKEGRGMLGPTRSILEKVGQNQKISSLLLKGELKNIRKSND